MNANEYYKKHEINEYPLIEIENIEKKPYFINSSDYTPKSRELYCQSCKYRIISDLYGAVCGFCHQPLITRVKEMNVENPT